MKLASRRMRRAFDPELSSESLAPDAIRRRGAISTNLGDAKTVIASGSWARSMAFRFGELDEGSRLTVRVEGFEGVSQPDRRNVPK